MPHPNAAVIAGTLAAGLALASPAFANWEFTRWGMSPAQVIKASKGKVGPASGTAMDQVQKFDIKAKGETRFNGRDWTAEFYFDKDDKLALVRLGLKVDGECDAMRAEYYGKYGASANKYHGDWTDPDTGEHIFMSDNRKYGLPCYVSYRRP